MKSAILLISLLATFVRSAPLYGKDGGYAGYASYVQPKNLQEPNSRTSLNSEDSIDTSAGSPDVSRQPSSEEDSSNYDSQPPFKRTNRRPYKPAKNPEYAPQSLPKKYDVLNYKPSHQHGYGGNEISDNSPYQRATIYGQSAGGYKIADTYQNKNVDSDSANEHDYSDDHHSPPQPYEFGYAVKDHHGNSQHRHEASDGHGSVKGTYGFMDEHGLYRSVEYVADKGGFRASIKTNEPGTGNKDPADVHIEAKQEGY